MSQFFEKFHPIKNHTILKQNMIFCFYSEIQNNNSKIQILQFFLLIANNAKTEHFESET